VFQKRFPTFFLLADHEVDPFWPPHFHLKPFFLPYVAGISGGIGQQLARQRCFLGVGLWVRF